MTLSDWKSLAITQVIMAEFKARQKQLEYELGRSAGVNPLDDKEKVGYIKAIDDFLNIELDEESHD